VVELLLLFENCQPENNPTPKMSVSAMVRSSMAPERPGRLRGGVGGPATGSGGWGGGWNAMCSPVVRVSTSLSKTLTGVDVGWYCG